MTEELDVVQDISPADGMFGGDKDVYFGVGRSALDNVMMSLSAAGVPADGVARVLDLPCGYGRVTRYLRAAFPRAELVACDLFRDGVDFCAKAFGATPVYSDADPARIPLPADSFDLIWVGSLLTHLDARGWDAFLELFRRNLRPGGVVVFSCHGRQAHDWHVRKVFRYGLPSARAASARYGFERKGFGYGHYDDSDSYGISFSRPGWVFDRVAGVAELRVVHFGEAAWSGHHDIFACVRDPDFNVGHPRLSTWGLLWQKFRGGAATVRGKVLGPRRT
jgi:SAM-dependent methyltransferase